MCKAADGSVQELNMDHEVAGRCPNPVNGAGVGGGDPWGKHVG